MAVINEMARTMKNVCLCPNSGLSPRAKNVAPLPTNLMSFKIK